MVPGDHEPELFMPPAPPPWGWMTVDHKASATCHVFPTWDIYGHIFSEECRCQPYIDENGFWSHNAWDGREPYEMGRKRH